VLLLCLLLPLATGIAPDWRNRGASLYVLPLLTLVNAPFDWAALGITRALLRKGLEQRGGWPLVWGAVDLLISLATVALLAIVVLFFTQLFNAIATYGGAREMVFDPLRALRDLAQPELRNQPKYFWLYFMLLTTQIPAILNLGAGFFCVVRSYDWGNDWLGRLIGEAPEVNLRARGLIAALQAAQFSLAFTAGGLLFYALFTGFISLELPAGGGLIDLLLWIANANWPARLLGVG
jgi:hypothetical protein